MSISLVIAVYDFHIEWTKYLNKDINIIPYRKGSNSSGYNEIKIEPNVGRDVHTFFFHIASNYDTLDDFTCFCQDFPFDHWENIVETLNGGYNTCRDNAVMSIGGYHGYHHNTYAYLQNYSFITKYNLPFNNTQKLKAGGYSWNNLLLPSQHHNYGKCLMSNPDGSPHHPNGGLPLDKFWSYLFKGGPPPHYEFIPGGHFGITKQHAHLRSKKFYWKIVRLLETYEVAPWCIERLESYIFDPRYEINDQD